MMYIYDFQSYVPAAVAAPGRGNTRGGNRSSARRLELARRRGLINTVRRRQAAVDRRLRLDLRAQLLLELVAQALVRLDLRVQFISLLLDDLLNNDLRLPPPERQQPASSLHLLSLLEAPRRRLLRQFAQQDALQHAQRQ